jgi:branched-chain amino acid aminotransferase
MSRYIDEAEWIWRDGSFIPWADARIHVLSTAVQFGSSVFEGIRCYSTPSGPAIFRLKEHIRRLMDSCRIYRMDHGRTAEEIMNAVVETVARNNFDECYIRPMVLRGYGAMGLAAEGSPIETWICAWPWGTYLGEGALENGVDVCVSSWHRPAPNTFPAAAKGAGHYNNAQLIRWQAQADGYAEAIALSPDGLVSEGSGQNVFLVRDRKVITPPLDGTNLTGITRDAILRIAEDLGLPTREQPVPRESLYTADEVFFTGTAAELTPVRSVDHIPVGEGKPGPITRALQQRFFGITRGNVADRHGWLTPVTTMVGARTHNE